MGDIADIGRQSPANWTTLLSCVMGKFVSRYKPIPPRKPIPMYTCAHCGVEFPRHQAMRQAGYCEACEYMEWKDVLKELVCAAETPANLHKAGRLSVVYVGHYPLYQRCEVEQEKARRRAKRIGWSHVLTLGS